MSAPEHLPVTVGVDFDDAGEADPAVTTGRGQEDVAVAINGDPAGLHEVHEFPPVDPVSPEARVPAEFDQRVHTVRCHPDDAVEVDPNHRSVRTGGESPGRRGPTDAGYGWELLHMTVRFDDHERVG